MPDLTITVIQPDIYWEDKEANLRHLEQKIHAITERTEVVVLPEMFTTGFSMRPEALAEKMDGPTLAWMRKMAEKKRVILTGSIIAEEGGNFFNRLLWVLPNGEYGGYDKRHLFAYAGEDEQYTSGDRRLIASVKGWKVQLLICYDLRFPVWSRQTPAETGSAEFDVLIYVANWPERRSHAWKTLLQARAIENQSYVIGVNRIGKDGNDIYYSGDSMVIDPLGEICWQGLKEESVFTYTLGQEKLAEIRRKFPFWRDADRFSIERK